MDSGSSSGKTSEADKTDWATRMSAVLREGEATKAVGSHDAGTIGKGAGSTDLGGAHASLHQQALLTAIDNNKEDIFLPSNAEVSHTSNSDLNTVLRLVDKLSAWDMKALMANLAKVDFRVDFMTRLPIELRMMLAKLIEKADLSSCIRVSGSWVKAFEQDDIVKTIADTHFPGLMQHAAALGMKAKDLLFVSIRKHHRRSQGRFRSALHHGIWLEDENYFVLDTATHPTHPNWRNVQRYARILVNPIPGDFKPINGLQMMERNLRVTNLQYAAGRIAWQPDNKARPDNSLIIVDNLRTQLRKIFRVDGLVQSGLTVTMKTLGDKLVVAKCAKQLFAWDLETNERASVNLPFSPKTIVSWGKRSVIVDHQEKLYVWTMGSSVLEVDSANIPKHYWPDEAKLKFRSGAVPDSQLREIAGETHPFIHPGRSNVFFTAKLLNHDVTKFNWPHGVITVNQYEGTDYTKTFLFNIADIPGAWLDNYLFWVQVRPANNCGSFTIATIRPNDQDGDNLSPAKYTRCHGNSKSHWGPKVYTITFNVYTKEFGVSSHHPFGGRRIHDLRFNLPKRWHFWDGQLSWWYQVDQVMPGMKGDFPVLTLNECQMEENGHGNPTGVNPPFYATARLRSRVLDSKPKLGEKPLRRKTIDFRKVVKRMHDRPEPQCRHIPVDSESWIAGLPAILRTEGALHGAIHAHRRMFNGVNLAFALDPDENTLVYSDLAYKLRCGKDSCSDEEPDPEADRRLAPERSRGRRRMSRAFSGSGDDDEDYHRSPARAPNYSFTTDSFDSFNFDEYTARRRMELDFGVADEDMLLHETNAVMGPVKVPELDEMCEAVFGDDDFLVVVHSQGYTVWAFNDDLPGSESLREKSMKSFVPIAHYWKRGKIQLLVE